MRYSTDDIVSNDDGWHAYRYRLMNGEIIEVGWFSTAAEAQVALSEIQVSVRALLLDARIEAGCDQER